MSSMVLTQLLNPEPGVDRKAPGKTPSPQAPADNGPSRYDEIVRQQEKRLEQWRLEDRARDRKMEQERQAESRRTDSAGKGREEQATSHPEAREAEPAAKTARQGRPEAPADRNASSEVDPGRKGQAADAGGKPETDTAIDIRSLEEQSAELLDLAEGAEAPFILGVNGQLQTGTAQALNGSLAAGLLAPGLTGQQPGASPTAGKLFTAMLEAGKESSAKGGGLLAGLQGGSSQLSGESSGKFADTLMARMSAPELTQSLSQSATLRGQEAQALMRSYTTSVDSPVGDNEWGEKVMGKLAWLTASQMSVAEIHITPPELGPLDVRVQVQNDQATVTVHATTPAVREQLELHGHRLRDMLSEQGLSLEGFDVSDSSSRETAGQQGDGEGRSEPGPGQLADEGDGTDADAIAAGSLDLSWQGEVDLYA